MELFHVYFESTNTSTANPLNNLFIGLVKMLCSASHETKIWRRERCGTEGQILKCDDPGCSYFLHPPKDPRWYRSGSPRAFSRLDINNLKGSKLILQLYNRIFIDDIPSLYKLGFIPPASFKQLGILYRSNVVPECCLITRNRVDAISEVVFIWRKACQYPGHAVVHRTSVPKSQLEAS